MSDYFHVMISSTMKDLPHHREEARDAVLRVQMLPRSMEVGTAFMGNAIDYSLKMVDESDIYIGIFAKKYGFIPEDLRNIEKISITEMEYRHAQKLGMPILIFVMDDNHPILGVVSDRDTFWESNEESKAKQKAFLEEIMKTHVVGFFKSPDQLRSLIIQALLDPHLLSIAKEYQHGRIVVTQKLSTSESDHLPIPPDPYYEPPYIPPKQFIGRTYELEILNSWVANKSERVLVFNAIGGMGKSALTWNWVKNYAFDSIPQIAGLIWWSFYEGGTTISSFITHALTYITRRGIDDIVKQYTYEERIALLLNELRRKPYLIILDGLERVLVAYHRLDAASMPDFDADEPNSKRPHVDVRSCTDPRDADFLRLLAVCEPSKVLISTRLMPKALEDSTGNPLVGVTHHRLRGLHPKDALNLMKTLGVAIKDERLLDSFVRSFGYHSLFLTIIAGRIMNSRHAYASFDQWYELDGIQLQMRDLEIKQRHSHILEYTFNSLSDTHKLLLGQIAIFNDSINYDALAIFNPYLTSEEVDSFNKILQQKIMHKILLTKPYRIAVAKFDRILQDLEEFGLLYWDRDNDRYDLHPIVRSYAAEQLRDEEKKYAYNHIHKYFSDLANEQPEVVLPRELEEIKYSISMYRALVGANRWDEAEELFTAKLHFPLSESIARPYTIIELLMPFFSEGLGISPNLLSINARHRQTTNLADAFNNIADFDSAEELCVLSLKQGINEENADHIGSSLQMYSIILQNKKQLAKSIRARNFALEVATLAEELGTIENHYDIVSAHIRLMYLYMIVGEFSKALREYQLIKDISGNTSNNKKDPIDVAVYLAEIFYFQGLDATVSIGKARLIAERNQSIAYLIKLDSLEGEIAYDKGDLDTAEKYFQTAITQSRKHGYTADEKEARGGLAKVRAAQLRYEEARELLVNDTNDLDAAEVYLHFGEIETAKKLALKAFESACADGLPYIYWWSIKQCEIIFQKLNMPIPTIPYYDEMSASQFAFENEVKIFIQNLNEKNERRKHTLDKYDQASPLEVLDQILREAQEKAEQERTNQASSVSDRNLSRDLLSGTADKSQLRANDEELEDKSLQRDGGISEKIAEQNIYFMLGISDISDEEKEIFLDKLQQRIWDDFVENDMQLLLTEGEYQTLQVLKAETYASEEEQQGAMIEYMEKLIPDLENILLEKALNLKEDMMHERINTMKDKYKGVEYVLNIIDETLALIADNKWYSASILLNSIKVEK